MLLWPNLTNFLPDLPSLRDRSSFYTGEEPHRQGISSFNTVLTFSHTTILELCCCCLLVDVLVVGTGFLLLVLVLVLVLALVLRHVLGLLATLPDLLVYV